MKHCVMVIKLHCTFLLPVCSGDLSVQVFVEMPFEIKTIESPSHKIKMKVTHSFNVPLHALLHSMIIDLFFV